MSVPLPRLLSIGVMIGGALFSSVLVCAETYPSRPIRLIVPFTAGGGVDIVARTLAQPLSEILGQTVVVDNRAGAGGSLGIAVAARATPDGYTLLLASSALTINPSIYKSLPYDPVNDLAPVTLTSVIPLVLVTSPTLPVSSVEALVSLAKSREKRLTYATSGVGNSTHLAMELFNSLTKTQMVHVPYKSTSQKNIDLVTGQVDMMFSALPTAVPFLKDGRMRALAVSGKRRSTVLRDVPTVAEAGVPGYELESWNGVLAPARTPAAIVARLNSAIVKALADSGVQSRLAALGAEAATNSSGEFAAYIRAEIAKYSRIVAFAGIPKE